MNLTEYISEKISDGTFIGKSVGEIASMLEVKSAAERKSIKSVLSGLEKDGVVTLNGMIVSTPERDGLVRGVLRGNERGYAFLPLEGGDLFIPNRSLHGALHKDEVLVKRVPGRFGEDDEAEVVRVLRRGVTQLSGTYYTERSFGFVRPDDKNYFTDIRVSFRNRGDAESGDKVLVKITDHDGRNPEGRVIEIFGKKYDLAAEEESIIAGFGYKPDFPHKVIAECDAIPDEVTEDRLTDRLDLTNELVITIDGDDSRDFDDAISLGHDENGNYILGVHIADVSEYVRAGSALDREAFDRSTSVYFPDRVIPMLPAKLSNGVCSLSEGVTRLTLSCFATVSEDGEIIDSKLVKSFIKSSYRMTYSKVQAMLDGDEETLMKYSGIRDLVFSAAKLERILANKRDSGGRINLEVKESDVTLKDGKISVGPRQDKEAYKIIEEFMLLANEIVAEYAFYSEVPFIYRVHEKPDAEKVASFVDFLALLGINVRWKAEKCRSRDFASVLAKAAGSPAYELVNKLMLRSMRKAKYSAENAGHFGLSSKCYCHFTSPIRRYPDLVVHRVVKMMLDGRIGELNDIYADFMASAADVSSESERKADEAERTVDDLYKTKYMEEKVGEEFDGVISGVTPSGVFCELPNTVEGFTRLGDLPRGNYSFEAETLSLRSPTHTFAIGQRVRVGVLSADVSSRRVDFIILRNYDDERPRVFGDGKKRKDKHRLND